MKKEEMALVSEKSIVPRIIENGDLKPKKGESLKNFTLRVIQEIPAWLRKNSSEPLVKESINHLKEDQIYKAIFFIYLRKIVCDIHTPFVIGEKPELTDEELLSENGISKDLIQALPEDALQSLIKKYRKPAQKMSALEKQKLFDEHVSKKVGDVYPDLVTFVLKYQKTKDGEKSPVKISTRDYHWKSEVQDLYVENFLKFEKALGFNFEIK